MDAVFKALADASRRELLDRLRADNGQTLNELCVRLDMTRLAVSKLWRSWRTPISSPRFGEAGRSSTTSFPVPIFEIGERWIGKFERSRLAALSDMKKALEKRDE